MTAQKQCPGIESLGRPAHMAPADLQHFNSNAGQPGGLSTRCRTDGALYGRAWATAKRAGEKFAAKGPVPPSVAAMLSVQEPATGDPSEPAAPPEAGGFPAAPTTVVARGVRQQLTYHDQLAVRAARGKAPGYSGEAVGGVIYALPEGATASTPEGQVALQVVNEARAAERRKRDAERKRAERAAKKAAAASDPGTESMRELLRLG